MPLDGLDIGRYHLLRLIGSGPSSGIVFRADRATTHLYYFIIDKNGKFYLKVYQKATIHPHG